MGDYKMKTLKLILVSILTAAVFIITSSCATLEKTESQKVETAPVSKSRPYQPISDWEQIEYDKANRDVHPDDVKKDTEKYRDTTIAWVGIISEVEIIEKQDHYEVILLAEHYYYDWIENFGPQTEIIFLSIRGEGKFKTKWAIKKSADISGFKDDVGKMIIAYGIPHSIADEVILLNTTYIRLIENKWFAHSDIYYSLEEKTDVNPEVFFRSVISGDLAKVEKLVNEGADVNAHDNESVTALMFAVLNGHREIAALLIQAGANIDTKNNYGFTALSIASLQGNTEMTNLLINNGASGVYYQGGSGDTIEDAIIIKGAQNEFAGVAAEYNWIDWHYPRYEKIMNSMVEKKEKRFDAITISTPAGSKNIYFDITDFFGKW